MKICMLSDSPLISTGFSNQSKLLAKYLTEKGHEVHFFANAYQGQPITYAKLEDGTEFKYKIYGQRSPYFQAELSQLLKQIKPDIFYVLLDSFMLHGQPRNPNGWYMNVDTSPARDVIWFPTDGGGRLPLGCENILKKFNKCVAMSKFGQKQVKEIHGIDTEYIPHGTEPDRFYRLPDNQRNELRRKWGLNDKFVVGSVFRNQPRKNPDRYFKAFNLIRKQIPNAVMLLHSDPMDPAGPILFQNQIAKYNLENCIRFTGMSAMKAWNWDDMNDVYNLMDVFFLPTSGEGFGIPIIEAMSCEVPVLATSYTTTPELVEETRSGFGIKLVGVEKINMFEMDSKDYDIESDNGTITGGGWEVERGIPDIKDTVEKIKFLYDNPSIVKEMGFNGRKAVLENYDFNKIVAPKWEKLMESMIK